MIGDPEGLLSELLLASPGGTFLSLRWNIDSILWFWSRRGPGFLPAFEGDEVQPGRANGGRLDVLLSPLQTFHICFGTHHWVSFISGVSPCWETDPPTNDLDSCLFPDQVAVQVAVVGQAV